MKNLKTKSGQILDQALSKNDLFINALFKRPESLSQYLLYDEYVKKYQLFRHKDGSLGAVFEVQGVEHEPLEEQRIIDLVDSLRVWLNFDENYAVQILFDQAALASRDQRLSRFENHFKNPNPVSKRLFSEKIRVLKEACQKKTQFLPLERKILLSVRYFPQGSKKAKQRESHSQKLIFQEMKGFVEEMQKFHSVMSQLEINSKIPLKALGAAELLDVLRRNFNPKTYYRRAFAPYNPNLSLSEQILYNSPTLEHSGITREGVKTRTISLKTSPHRAYPGGMAYFTTLPFPFQLSLNFSFPPKGVAKRFFDLKEFFLENSVSARSKRQLSEIREVQDQLAQDDRCLHMTFKIVVEGESDEELDEKTRRVINIFHNQLECESIVDEDIGLGLYLNTLPLNYLPQADSSTQRYIRILRSDAIQFVPIFDSFRGLTVPNQVYLSREGNVVPFSLLENETSNHTCLLADSGSGKSAFVIDCIQAMKKLDPEPLVFVIDRKTSYGMLSNYFDGDITVFDQNIEMPFSPFRGVYDEEKISFLTRLMITAIDLTSENFVIESEHRTAISKALKLAYLKKQKEQGLAYIDGELRTQSTEGEVQMTMEDFIEALVSLPSEEGFEGMREAVEALLLKLKPFYGDGSYARYFRGSQTKERKQALFYVYDLDGLKDPLLRTLITMAVTEEIRQMFKLPANQGRTGLVVVEELGTLVKGSPQISDFIVDAAETYRKLGIWLLSVAPRPQAYFKSEAGQAIWGVADNYLFLQMSEDNVNFLAKNSEMIDEASKEIIKSLRTKKDQYADVFYMNKKKTRRGAFRYRQTAYDKWLAPTNAPEFQKALLAIEKFSRRKVEST